MPNSRNINSPITIVGNGRSGTSLVSRILGGHSHCQFVGETANLIHSVVKSMECSLTEKKQAEIPNLIRRQFQQLFASEQARWLHKPIGIPIVQPMFADEDAFIDWYWDVFEQIFPDAVFLTVLRHPLDVVVSSHRWWGDPYAPIIERNRLAARLITHPKSKVHFAVNYHELIANPPEEVIRLLGFVGLDFEPACLDAVESGHVLNETSVRKTTTSKTDLLASRREISFSHRESWKEIDPELITPAYREAVDQVWNRFGFESGGWDVEGVV